MNKFPKVFTIILNYNGKETIKQCLNSVFQSRYPNFEVVVVDNNSKDGSFELIRKFFPKAHLIRNEKNIGFGAGNNIGIRFALEKMADYIFLLNNDALLEQGTLEKLVEESEKSSNIGMASPIIVNPDSGKTWFAGGKISFLKMKTIHFQKPKFQKEPYQTDHVTGCAVLIRKETFKDIGLFDEDFFLYYEDADFSIRAAKKGYTKIIIPEAKVYHLENSEIKNKEKTYWLVLSGLLFFKKHTPLLLKPWILINILLRKTKNKINTLKGKGKNKDIIQVQKAFHDFNKIK